MRTKHFSVLLALVLLSTFGAVAQQRTLEPSPERLQQHVKHLASDVLEGRRTGTPGATEAARYIAREFSRLGLKPLNQTGSSRYLQTFPYVTSVKLGAANALSLGDDAQLEVGVDWVPLTFSASAKAEGSVVFVGHGITASELNHDDYAGVSASGKIAIALQGTPDGVNPHGQFGRLEGVRWKAIAARNAGAKALLVVARENFKDDPLTRLVFEHTAGDAGLPVVVVSRPAIDRLLALSNLSLAGLERPPRNSRALTGQIKLSTEVVRNEAPAYNVIGKLEGSDPLLKNEVIVIGAHYDHLGRGGSGSLSPRSGEIHYGADDNASGTAGVLELARLFAAHRPRLKRTIVFMAFGGEEEGLLGSNYYVNNPLAPLANTIAMINMDMIGRMKDRRLVIGGVGTAKEWRDLIAQANSDRALNVTVSSNRTTGRFEVTMNEDGYGPSDHSSFYSKQIPVLFFWTGTHADYHKPTDTFEKINYEDEARILAMVAGIVRDIDGADKRLTFTTARSDAVPRTGGFRVYLGTIPSYSDSSDGLVIDGVRDDSPAAKAGLKAGDKIVKIGSRDIKNVYDYTFALGEMKGGEEYVIEVLRGEEKLSLKITPIKR